MKLLNGGNVVLHQNKFKSLVNHFAFGGTGLCTVQPPSTMSCWPVICLDAGDNKNKAALAISATVAGLPIGVLSAQPF